MPRIEQIIPAEYDGLWPYRSEYDNIPVKTLETRIDLVNDATDQNEQILNSAIGSAGTLAARLNVSLEDSGDLKSDAVDDTLHSVGAHTDGLYDGIEYVRMLLSERNKLTDIATNATALQISFETPSVTSFTNETVAIEGSDTITWEFTAPNIIKANMAFPPEAAHQHYYGLTPVHADLMTPDYTNYKVTSMSTPFVEDSLRVYVNGIRIDENGILVYGPDGPSGTWLSTSYTPTHGSGIFELNRALDPSDTILIDFDISLS